MVPGTATWQTENPDLMERAVACLTLEHLGATEWKDDAEGRYGPTGKVTFGSAFTGLRSMADVYLESAKDAQADRMVMLDPTGGIYFGEGSSFWKAGIPTISYMGSSWYLFTAPPLGEISKLDRERLYDQIATAALCVERIDGMSVEEIRAA